MKHKKSLKDIPVWVHTNIPSPYRKHQFELIAKEFPRAKFFFYTPMDKDRPWADNISTWDLGGRGYRTCVRFVQLGKFGRPSLSVIWNLLKQPVGTIHLVGCMPIVDKCWFWLIGYLGLGTCVEWGDAGFPETVSPQAERRWKRILTKGITKAYHPGKLGKKLCTKLGFPDAAIYNAYFSHDVAQFDQFYRVNYKLERQNLREKLNISMDDYVVLNISRYLDLKRLEDDATALELIENCNPTLANRIIYILIGDGPWRDHLPLLKKLKRIRVILQKPMEPNAILSWYCVADVFSFPSEGDIWGLVVNEALSMRLPVICTERIGASELINDGVNGYRVPIRSPERIARHLNDMLSDQRQLDKMKHEAGNIINIWRTEFGIVELKRLVAESVINCRFHSKG